ncbi:MAG: FHA domain-containing protein [Deltaproteobacteria bacterium]|nr:FHA domain-containing protein [Myxococcales bacterium]MDP3219421.1 FHA domain-containing protein [Deltaproteobacteria bacterium]
MGGDPQSKNPRQFNCREYLWETFEQMSQELDVTLDYLINESMRQYARGRERGGPMVEQPEQPERLNANMGGYRPQMPGMGQPPQQQPPPQRPGMPGMGQGPQQRPGMPGMGPAQGMPGQSAQRLPSMSPGQMAPRPGMPTNQPMQPQGRPGMPGMGAPPPQRPGMPGMGAPPPQQQQPMQPPAPQRPPPPQARPSSQGRTLIALFEGQQYPVTKEEFVIGRGQKTTDLTIRDSNVSRRHASVVLYNGQYWIVDQQSTNGIDYQGGKVDRKVIEDGDSYRICDHEIQFVYR